MSKPVLGPHRKGRWSTTPMAHHSSGRSRSKQGRLPHGLTCTSKPRAKFLPLSPGQESGARIHTAPFTGVAAFVRRHLRGQRGGRRDLVGVGDGGGLGFRPPLLGGGDTGERTGRSLTLYLSLITVQNFRPRGKESSTNTSR
jgi:hypothetical protein